MAMLEHDTDKFSSKLLSQFSKGHISGPQFSQSMKMQESYSKQLGTVANFMKNDLRLQASSNQFTQRTFRINKKSIDMAADYFALDKKVRKEERDYYEAEKQQQKHNRRKNKLVEIWRDEVLKAAKKTENNTQTLQTAQRIRTATTLARTAGGLISGGMSLLAVRPMMAMRKKIEDKNKQSLEINRSQTKSNKIQQSLLKGIDKGIGGLIRATEFAIAHQERGNARRDAKQERRREILERHGVIVEGQTKEDKRKLKRLEESYKADVKALGRQGFSPDEEKEAKKRLKEQAREVRRMRKSGVTATEYADYKIGLSSHPEVVAQGRRRQRFKGTARRFGRGAAVVGGGVKSSLGAVGGLAMKAAPALGVIAGAGLLVNQIKEGDFKGALSEIASSIPVVSEIKEGFLAISDLIPKGIKDSFMKFSGKIFSKMWSESKLRTGVGSGGFMDKFSGLFSALTRMFNLIGRYVKFFLSTFYEIASGPFFTALDSTVKWIVSLGKTALEATTGVLNFLTAIFGEEKASFGKAFMEHLWPPIKRFSLELLPKTFQMISHIFSMVGSVLKGLIIGLVGDKVAGWFGLQRDPGAMTQAATTIQAGQDKLRQSNADLARMKGGASTVAIYNSDGYDAAMDHIKEQERVGDVTHEEADKLRSKINDIRSAEKQVSAGKEIRRQEKEKMKTAAAKEAAKEANKKTSAKTAPPSDPKTAAPTPATTPIQSSTTTKAPGEEKRVFKSESLAKDLRDASAKYSIPLNYLQTMAKIESRGNPNAVSPTGATGIFQFTKGTGRQYGLVGPGFDIRKDQRANVMAGAALARDNATALAKSGLPNTPAYLYLAHQQGIGGAKIIARAAAQGVEVPPKIRYNMDVNGGKGLTPGQFLHKWETKWAKMSGDTSSAPIAVAEATPSTTNAPGGATTGSTLIEKSVSVVSSGASAVGAGALSAVSTVEEYGIAGKMGSFANKIITEGPGFLSKGVASLSGKLEGTKSGVVMAALDGARIAAQDQLSNMYHAMDSALSSDPAMQALARSTSEMNSYTQELANREDKNLFSFIEKVSDPFTSALQEYLSGMSV